MEADADDAASARTVLRLQLEEIEEAVNATTDPVEIAILNNQAAAFRAQYQEVVKSDRIQSDQRMQKSVCQAMLSDFPVVDVLLEQEASTSAARVQRQPGNGTAPPPLREHGRDGYFDDPRVDPNGNADVETFIESLTIDEKHAPRQCYMCTDNQGYSQTTIVGDCDHVWCRSCLTEAFELATKNESNYPVRCCRDSPIIPLDHPGIVSLVGHELISAVQAKVVEYETADKTYCHDPKCSTFIVPTTIEEARAVCATCQKITCAQCKAEYHGEEECKTANDEAFEQWQQVNEAATCRSCRRVVIISYGCNHMRCFCGAEFCYECGETWKTCRCARWHVERLLERAEVMAQRQADNDGQPADVERVVEELLNEGDCRHTDWTRINLDYVTGSHTCADCNWRADEFLWECDRCHMRVCTRCKRDY